MWQKGMMERGQIRPFFLKDKSSVNEYLLLVIFSLLLAVSILIDTQFGKHLHIPGHQGLLIMPLLIIGKMKCKNKFSATYMAVFSTMTALCVVPIFGNFLESAFKSIVIPAITIDIVWQIIDKFRDKYLICSAMVAFLSGLSYMSTDFLLRITWNFGFEKCSTSHSILGIALLRFVFGLVGGVIGFSIGFRKDDQREKEYGKV